MAALYVYVVKPPNEVFGGYFMLEVVIMKTNTRKLTMLALFAAICSVLTYISFPLLPIVDFIKYDPADVIVLMVTFLCGVPAGLCVVVIAALFQSLYVSPDFPFGFIMHVISSATLLTVSGLIYRRRKTRGMALAAMLIAGVCVSLIMVPANLIFTPIYKGAPVEAVKELLLPGIIPVNLLKSAINIAITFILYKPVSRLWGKFSQTGDAL